MAGRRTNLALLLLVPAAVLTGGMTFLVGSGPVAPVVVAHGVVGLALLVLSPWKAAVARRGLRRRRPGRGLSLALTALVLLALVSGLAHSTGTLLAAGPVTALQVHVAAAVGALVLTAAHVRRRRTRPRSADLSRRSLLRAGGLALAAAGAYAALEGAAALALPGATRRATGFGTRQHDTGFGTPQHEDGSVYTYPTPINFGAVTPPPAARVSPTPNMDYLAHWYNDFGRDHTALVAGSANGWYGWYDWQWNRPTNTGDGVTRMGYDPSRHPIQGFYKGDNADVLGWQCYWLAEAGIAGVCIVGAWNGFSSTAWSNPADEDYWVYQLFTNVPNFRALRYVLSLRCTGTKAEVEAQNSDVVNIYDTRPGAYTYTEAGLQYAVVTLWDMEAMRGIYDSYNGQTATVAYLKALAAKFKAIGYDGVMVMARNAGLVYDSLDPTLKRAGVIVVAGEYGERYAADSAYSNSYANYAANAVFPTAPGAIVNVVTSAKTQFPHPSGWALAGSTPAAFRHALSRAVDSVTRHKQKRIITIYNVSEWAEGGPGLIPNKRDGFGYLDAIRSITVAR